MKKYKLYSSTSAPNSKQSIDLTADGFGPDDFEQYENGKLSNSDLNTYQDLAAQQQGFEWWIEEEKP